MDELVGIKKLMVSAIGAKLAPKIPPFFSEVVKTERLQDGTFNWSTFDTGMDLKHSALPNSNRIKPDFQQIVTAYERRLRLAAQATPTVLPAMQPPAAKIVPPVAPLKPATVV